MEGKKQTGLIHIYCGDGKGKTTTGMGLCARAAGKKSLGVSCRYETATAQRISGLTDMLMDGCAKLEADLAALPSGPEAAMRYCHDVLIPDMTAARETADTLETLTAGEAWPFPVYSELLFSV